MNNPFQTETVILRVPLVLGERTVRELHIKPPKLKDVIGADQYAPGTTSYSRAILSSLTGEPENILGEMVPEDWADCRVIITRTIHRFIGDINLLDEKEAPENPTEAGTPQTISPQTSGKLPEN